MNIYDIIIKKRDGKRLSSEEISFFVDGYTNGRIPDYQASALLMAIFFQKMDREETFDLTMAMRDTGMVLDLGKIKGIKVDKHSSGGVGDKTTLIVVPMVAACNIPVAKISGRGLGFTGGTVDKLEAIPGFKTQISTETFVELVNKNFLGIMGQTEGIARGDKLIYALRDVTGTVENLSLIAASIMSKKLASGSDKIVLDVKCGQGAFMTNVSEATRLARLMVDIGRVAGKTTVAIVSDMNEPLGLAVGNSLEVVEAIEVLKGQGPADTRELSIQLAAAMIYLGKDKVISIEEAREMARETLKNGRAMDKMRDLIKGQGGDESILDDTKRMAHSDYFLDITAKEEGYVKQVLADKIGTASRMAGAGRLTKEQEIDLGAGILLNKKIGDQVKKGELLARVFAKTESLLADAGSICQGAFKIDGHTIEGSKQIIETIGLP